MDQAAVVNVKMLKRANSSFINTKEFFDLKNFRDFLLSHFYDFNFLSFCVSLEVLRWEGEDRGSVVDE